MGVMACSRASCRNVMCDKLILEGSRYICNDCNAELQVYRKTLDKASMSIAGVRKAIEDFMRSEPGSFSPSVNASEIEAEFDRLLND